MTKNEITTTNSSVMNTFTGESIIEQMPVEKVDALKKMIGPKYKDVTNEELEVFLIVAVQNELDPFIKEIFFSKQNGAVVPITARDGFLKIAKKDPGYDAVESWEVRKNDEFSIDAGTGEIHHSFGTADRGEIIGAWARAYHKNRRPLSTYVNFKEYFRAGYDSWRDYPSAMIKKVAEVIVLKRQFSINGIVGAEELGVNLERERDGIGVEIPISWKNNGPVQEGEVVPPKEDLGEQVPKKPKDKITPVDKHRGEEALRKADKSDKDNLKELDKEQSKEAENEKLQKQQEKNKAEAEKELSEKKSDSAIDDLPDPEELQTPKEKTAYQQMDSGCELLNTIQDELFKKAMDSKDGEMPTLKDIENEVVKRQKAGSISVKDYMQINMALSKLKENYE